MVALEKKCFKYHGAMVIYGKERGWRCVCCASKKLCCCKSVIIAEILAEPAQVNNVVHIVRVNHELRSLKL